MIRANDLRIGNYHETFPISIPRIGIQQVTIEGKGYSAITSYGIHLVECGNVGFKPITITEEWLLKFGFKQKTESGWFYRLFDPKVEDELSGIAINIHSYVVVVSDVEEEMPVYVGRKEYVHELQNLLFAISGEELIVSA